MSHSEPGPELASGSKNIENQRAVAEPGVFTLVLKNPLARHGYIYQPDPASEKGSIFGGNFGENSGGLTVSNME